MDQVKIKPSGGPTISRATSELLTPKLQPAYVEIQGGEDAGQAATQDRVAAAGDMKLKEESDTNTRLAQHSMVTHTPAIECTSPNLTRRDIVKSKSVAASDQESPAPSIVIGQSSARARSCGEADPTLSVAQRTNHVQWLHSLRASFMAGSGEQAAWRERLSAHRSRSTGSDGRLELPSVVRPAIVGGSIIGDPRLNPWLPTDDFSTSELRYLSAMPVRRSHPAVCPGRVADAMCVVRWKVHSCLDR